MQAVKVRDLIQHLERHGGERVRTTGSHGFYRMPDGTVVSLVVKHQNDDVSPNVLATVRRGLRRAGVATP